LNKNEKIVKIDRLIQLPQFQVIIYKKCQYTVLPSEIDAHFAAKKAHRFGKKARDRIIQEITKVSGLIQNKEELRKCEFLFPSPTSKPIIVLA
jgi:Zn-finger domain-containing protein